MARIVSIQSLVANAWQFATDAFTYREDCRHINITHKEVPSPKQQQQQQQQQSSNSSCRSSSSGSSSSNNSGRIGRSSDTGRSSAGGSTTSHPDKSCYTSQARPKPRTRLS
jgi:hypothetical protein